jgi:hypothetical protein
MSVGFPSFRSLLPLILYLVLVLLIWNPLPTIDLKEILVLRSRQLLLTQFIYPVSNSY